MHRVAGIIKVLPKLFGVFTPDRLVPVHCKDRDHHSLALLHSVDRRLSFE